MPKWYVLGRALVSCLLSNARVDDTIHQPRHAKYGTEYDGVGLESRKGPRERICTCVHWHSRRPTTMWTRSACRSEYSRARRARWCMLRNVGVDVHGVVDIAVVLSLRYPTLSHLRFCFFFFW
ncbi:hypothetical protein L210DRAFT_2768453 [Boletus edulis BED1]|uniref:Uncharacterized protein n=1 Tax=Boletus edulis BED1 TaxID=1328754 RepID=A0AAD4BJK4_BOLED|nr:hypothetical protein L210DRAFT_2768453 [Boletus edulis BED1]